MCKGECGGEQIVVAVAVGNNGSDGLMRPMLEQLDARLGQLPQHHIVDGGFAAPRISSGA